jgi:hypothetical protein
LKPSIPRKAFGSAATFGQVRASTAPTVTVADNPVLSSLPLETKASAVMNDNSRGVKVPMLGNGPEKPHLP